MIDTNIKIEKMMLEDTGINMLDSGSAYGRHFQKNNINGINKNITEPIEFYVDEEEKSIELEQTVNIYDFLTKHLEVDATSEAIEEVLYKVMNEKDIDYYSIWDIQELFENNFIEEFVYNQYYDEKTDDYKEEFYYKEIPSYLEPSYMFDGYKWINTYNGDEYTSQTLQFLCFSDGVNDYILLQIHGGCDVRGGYTLPRVFNICDIDYFLMYMNTVETYCNCGLNDYMVIGFHEYINTDGACIGPDEIYKNVYIDKEENLRCKKCNAIIKQYSPDF